MDFEWYLRRCGEDELAVGHGSSLASRADALVAAGALARDRAETVLDDYDRAWRARRHGHSDRSARSATVTSPPPPSRVVACAQELTVPGAGPMTLELVVLAPTLGELWVRVAPGAEPWHRLHAVPVLDDRGGTHTAHFTGSGRIDDVSGVLSVDPALPTDAGFLVVAGIRVELTDVDDGARVVVEPRPVPDTAAGRANAHVRWLIESHARSRPINAIALACDTYVDCGILPVDAAVLDEARVVEPVAPSTQQYARAPGEVVRLAPAGVVTPEVDGVCFGVLALSVGDAGFVAAIDSPERMDGVDLFLVVSAVDDVGGTYDGEPWSRESGPDGVRWWMSFLGRVDPAVTWIRLDFALPSAYLHVRVPVPGRPA